MKMLPDDGHGPAKAHGCQQGSAEMCTENLTLPFLFRLLLPHGNIVFLPDDRREPALEMGQLDRVDSIGVGQLGRDCHFFKLFKWENKIVRLT
jgi:hypothetical protein